MSFRLLVAIALFWPGAAFAQAVAVDGGNVVYRASAQSAPRRLTTGGRDREPVLSPDGRTVAFVRGTPGDSVDTALGRQEATALWVVGTNGSGARMLVAGRAAAEPQRTLAAFQSPRFSPDGGVIYFLSSAWVTSAAVHAVEPGSGAERFVVAGNSLEVVPRGEYAGHLLVGQHRYFLAGGSYDWIWLFTPAAREVGPVGASEEAAGVFMEMYAKP
jgi:dipeptidyl aminopeptidase/acylaminoacyl peptidase